MKLPNGDKAVVPDDKLYGYLLNEGHETQPGHAVLFRVLLGITPANADRLRSALLDAAAGQPARYGDPSPFGVKYEIEFEMDGPRGRYTVLSVWIIEHGKDRPRLVTAIIP